MKKMVEVKLPNQFIYAPAVLPFLHSMKMQTVDDIVVYG